MAVSICANSDKTTDKKKRQEIALRLDRGTYRPSSESIAEAVIRYLRKHSEALAPPASTRDGDDG